MRISGIACNIGTFEKAWIGQRLDEKFIFVFWSAYSMFQRSYLARIMPIRIGRTTDYRIRTNQLPTVVQIFEVGSFPMSA
jgi:hypothetical protein